MTKLEQRGRVLVTGGAGFIGYHLCRRLLEGGSIVTIVDGMTEYYDVTLKHRRLNTLRQHKTFGFETVMLEDMPRLSAIYDAERPDIVVHLAAQAGVRYSLENPAAYCQSNLVGTFNLLECIRSRPPRHFLLASTSSVYGANETMPFREVDRADHPLTLYAATKKATEEMAHAYAHLWSIPTTAFRFFTVYGPWGRPDMALFKFVRAILAGEPIEVYGNGAMRRDFTYVDDLVEAIVRLIDRPPELGKTVDPVLDTLSPVAPHRVVNIGGGHPVELMDFIAAIEMRLGRRAIRTMLPMQPGDVPETVASPDLLRALTGYVPQTPVEEGIRAFVDWYLAEEAPRTWPASS